jgi:hypothetical protein
VQFRFPDARLWFDRVEYGGAGFGISHGPVGRR